MPIEPSDRSRLVIPAARLPPRAEIRPVKPEHPPDRTTVAAAGASSGTASSEHSAWRCSESVSPRWPTWSIVIPDLPNLRTAQPDVSLASIVYSADGEEIARFYREDRIWKEYHEISPQVIEALIAAEDHRFL
jgi:hypothetical protein